MSEQRIGTSGGSEDAAKDDSGREARLNKLLLDSLPHAAMLIRKDRTILAANKLATEVGALVGGVCWHDFGHCGSLTDKDKACIKDGGSFLSYETHCTFCLADKALSEQKSLSDPEVHAFGRIWDTYWVPLDDEVYLHYAIDITERRAAEEQLADSEDKFRTVVEQSPVAIEIYAPTGEMLSVNDAWARFWGLEKDTVSDFNILLDPECERTGLTAAFKEAQKGMTRVLPELCYDAEESGLRGGHKRWITARMYPIKSPDQSVKNIVLTYDDITERKQYEEREKKLQEKLTRAGRMESVGILAGGVAHDLNNVLGPLVLLPDVIADDLADSEGHNTEDIAESLEVIKTAANRAAKIVTDLVHLGRRGNYSLVPFDINEHHCITGNSPDIESIRTANPGVTIAHKLARECLVISADESHLSRAICNLLQNGAESIEKKGKVTLRTSKKSISESITGYEIVPKGDYAVIEITDTGAGIDEELLAQMFEPFVTRKKNTDKSGSGLGLSVVHGIIKDHNGFIDVSSEVGKGSVFTLYMPLIDRPDDEKETSEAGSVVGGTERVLIVDDEPGQRFIGRKSLKRLGYEVAEVEDGQQALEHFEKAKKSGSDSPYDLVVLDMIMTDGFDGLKTYQAIQDLFPKQKVIICSGHAQDSRAKAAQDLGADWLAKPYEMDALAQSVRKRLDRD